MAHDKSKASSPSDGFTALKKAVVEQSAATGSARQQQVLDIVDKRSIQFSRFVDDVADGKRKPVFTKEIIASQGIIADEIGIQPPQANAILRTLVEKHSNIVRVKLPKGEGRPVFSYYNVAKLSDRAKELLHAAAGAQ